jgi:hypothetical protein
MTGGQLSPELLRQIGEALYGDRWQTAMSRDLNVVDRTVRRWVAGADTPRPGVAAELRELLRARGQGLREQISKIDKALAAVIDREKAPRA